MKLNIIKNSKYFYLFSGTLLLISLLSLIAWGLKPGIDFTGGSFLELNFMAGRPATGDIQKALTGLDLGELKIQESGEKNIILRFKHIDEETHQKIISQIRDNFKNERDPAQVVQEERFESVGPIIGKELRDRSWLAIFLASIMIIGYIAYAFRKVSKPVASWKFGVIAVVALVHDTIVVFDRTRENLSKHYSFDFSQVVNDSINQTLIRSINTSVTILLVLITLYIFGGSTISNFVLALIVGIIIGTYSSIFVASTLIVSWHNWSKRLKKKP